MKYSFTLIFLILSISVWAQQTCSIKIFVKQQNQQVLSGAQIYAQKSHVSFITNEKGFALCVIPCKPDTLLISYIGYKDVYVALPMISDTIIHVIMSIEEIGINKVVVTQVKENSQITNTLGELQVKHSELRSIPGIMGEPDVLRTLSLSSGVKQIEGMQGIFVRGGSQDQNLIVYDGATVYNPSHLLGFFSVFNSDIVASASLFSSGAPALYGGRLSSVLTIQSLSAIPDSVETAVNLGVLSSRVMLNVPISQKSAIRASFRKTYLNLFVMPIVEKSLELKDEVSTQFGFYDATCRFDFKPNLLHQFYISAYLGKDKFGLLNSQTLLTNNVNWGNFIVAAQWKYNAKNRWIHSITASYSEYNFNFLAKQSVYTLGIETGISKKEIQYTAKKRYENHTVSYGVQANFHMYNSGTIDVTIENEPFNSIPAMLSQSSEQSLFVEDEWFITPQLICNASIRIVPYVLLGPSSYYVYNDKGEVTDTVFYTQNQIMYTTIGFEPRLQLQYRFSSDASLKFSSMRTTQQMHMVSMLSAALPADIWLPASNFNKPMNGWISSVGYFRNFNDNEFSSSLSLYYKSMQNIIEFKDGFITLYASSYNQKITHGKGFAFGSEFVIKKIKGDFQGAFSYNFSRSLRCFQDLNQGYLYPASYDKPHDVSIQLQYKISSQLTCNALWVYNSGKVYSEPVSKYFIGKNVISEYGPINSSRMPAYHRLDIGAQYVIAKTDSYELLSNISIYNVYNRKNTYYIYYETIGNVNEFSIQFVKNFVGLFPILPSVSIQLYF